MNLIKKGSSIERDVLLLQAFLREAEYLSRIDGRFGAGTDIAVRRYQLDNALVSDGIVGQKTWTMLISQFPELLRKITEKYLSEQDIKNTSNDLDLEVAIIKAVNEVESRGAGFIVDQPKILFEGHVFFRQLKKHGLNPANFQDEFPGIVYPRFNRSHYLGGLREYDRLAIAKTIHPQAALESASWGSFQVMGFNAKEIGYPSVETFVKNMHRHERDHLKSLARFLQANGLIETLRRKNWKSFARKYNGPKFSVNKYDIRLERAYRRHSQ